MKKYIITSDKYNAIDILEALGGVNKYGLHQRYTETDDFTEWLFYIDENKHIHFTSKNDSIFTGKTLINISDPNCTIAIKGSKKHSKLILEFFEDLGYPNSRYLKGYDCASYYYITKDFCIGCASTKSYICKTWDNITHISSETLLQNESDSTEETEIVKKNDLVLCKTSDKDFWHLMVLHDFYRKPDSTKVYICAEMHEVSQCMPFKGNEGLLGHD